MPLTAKPAHNEAPLADAQATAQRSNGFLPLAPLKHREPTALGLWDMEAGGPLIRRSGDGLPQAARDQVVLARLHGQPLALLHLPPGEPSRAGLVAAAWDGARQEILDHVRAHGCMPVPSSAAELGEVLVDGTGGSGAPLAPRPPGRAAVIVCTVGHEAVLKRTLESLLALDCDDFEIIVVDNRPSHPGARRALEGFDPEGPIRYVAEERRGLAAARNAGLAAAAGAEYVAFTDDDVVVDRHWLTWLLAPFTSPEVEATTGLVLPLSLNSAAEKRFELYAGFGKGLRTERYDLTEHRADDRFLYPYWGGMFGSGNSMAFRRDALLAVGGFDAALGAGTPTGGGEDLAAFTDVILAGGQLVYEPRSLCWHEHRGDEQALRAQVRNYGVGLTAVFTRYLFRDRHFITTALRSLPAIARLAKSRNDDRELERLPADLGRIELRGRALGPWRYLLSRSRVPAADPRSPGP